MNKITDRVVNIDGRFYDTKTSNDYFLKCCLSLKDMGEEHWYHPLEICDIKLIEVEDSISETILNGGTILTGLDLEMIQRVLKECNRNFWYYLREIAKMRIISIANMRELIHSIPQLRGGI